ncbi:redox-active disulfide protein 2 [Pedobacter sp. Leaf41]|jgi:Na+-transporting methylmalonyl-CoA/oxaloacetate decarboxylase beta subunit|uniref:redox-active disulfide protein 2 n=1 Tax=Pedobacter sp. Leaf41 TaxID=1736218 RepID=UPI000A750BEE|nr:redox-active disulfide protein 2 [Pedobacter sp. Leaf41]
MSENKFAEMSNKQLQKSEKVAKASTSTLVVMLVLLFALSMYLNFKKGFTPLTVIPISLLPIVISNLSNIKQMQEELKSRNL